MRRRCPAVRPPGHADGYYGRCDLRRGHDTDHALERGMEVVRWSTEGRLEVGGTLRVERAITDVAVAKLDKPGGGS